MKVYVVTSEVGSYSDYRMGIESAWSTEEAAQNECERRVNVDKLYTAEMKDSNALFEESVQGLSFDQRMRCIEFKKKAERDQRIRERYPDGNYRGYDETSYDVVELELDQERKP